MLDIMYDHGNSGTKELSISMKRQLGISVVEQPAVVPVPAPQPQPPVVPVSQPKPPDIISSSSSSNTIENGASECLCVCVCVTHALQCILHSSIHLKFCERVCQ